MGKNSNDPFVEKLHNQQVRACAEQWITLGYSEIADVIYTAFGGPIVIMPDYFEEDAWKIKNRNSQSC